MSLSSSEPLKIVLMGFHERDRAMLNLFFRMHYLAVCRLVASEDEADFCILDLDSVHGSKLLQHQRDYHLHRPLIALSVRDLDIDGVQFLRKPIQVKTLKQVIEFYRSELTHQPTVTKIIPPPPDNNGKVRPSAVGFSTKSTRNTLTNLENQTRIIHDCCGTVNTIDLNAKRSADRARLYYDPSKRFQHILKEATDRCRQMKHPIRLHLPDDKHITLLPKADRALTDLSDAKLRPRCLLEIKQSEIGIEPFRHDEIQLLQSSEQSSQPLDTLLWKVALLSSRGRLPIGTDIEISVGLQHWPNLTRLLNIPQFFRIAALWARSPQSLAKTQQTLNIEARYICAFFSACLALELLNIQPLATSTVTDTNIPKSSRSGLFRRILRHLRMA